MRTVFREYSVAIIAIVVALIFFTLYQYITGDKGAIWVFNTYEKTPDDFSAVQDGVDTVPHIVIDSSADMNTNDNKNVFTMNKSEYDSGTNSWISNPNAYELSIPADQVYPFYYVSYDELIKHVKLESSIDVAGGTWTVNVSLYKPVLTNGGSVVTKKVQARDSFGNLLYDTDGSPMLYDAVSYIEYYVGDLKQCSPSDINVNDLYKGRFGYDSIGLYTASSQIDASHYEEAEGTRGILVYNNYYPVKLKVVYRYTYGTMKSEYTALFSNKVDALNLDSLSYDEEYDRIFGGG